MGIRALRLVAGAAATAATFAVAAGPAGPAQASTGEVVIAVTAGSGLEAGEQADGSWHIETVATGLYGQPSVAIESNGIIVMAAVFLTGAYRGGRPLRACRSGRAPRSEPHPAAGLCALLRDLDQEQHRRHRPQVRCALPDPRLPADPQAGLVPGRLGR